MERNFDLIVIGTGAGGSTVAHKLSSVGMREDEATKKGLKFKVKYEDTSGWYSSQRIGLKYSAYKTLVEQDTGLILGAHLLGRSC